MEHITTFTGEDFTPISPNIEQIKLRDIAHALSLMCRANGHFVRFFSVAQHSINCAREAMSRKLSNRIQLACLLHDASEAYLSDITRPIKRHLPEYIEIEKRLQYMIYTKFLTEPLSEEEHILVKQIDDDMLYHEFDALMKKRVFINLPNIASKPLFDFQEFESVENEFVALFNEITSKPTKHKNLPLTQQLASFEKAKSKFDIDRCLAEYNIKSLLLQAENIKRLSAQIDVKIHAYGILCALTNILDENEQIEYLSLGAGNTGKAFDLCTNKQIAEFKFIKWNGKNDTIRQDSIFKDFIELALDNENVGKLKYIYCFNADIVRKFFSQSKRNLDSVLSRNSVNKKYEAQKQKYRTVSDFYKEYENTVLIRSLEELLY